MLTHALTLEDCISLLLLCLSAVRIVKAAILTTQGRERWTQLVLPTLVIAEFSRLLLGSATRMSHILLLTGAELLLVCGCIAAVWRLPDDKGRSVEERLYRHVRLFLPTRLADPMTQELMAFISCARLFRSSSHENESASASSFSYVQASPIRALPLMLAVGALPELLILHFALKAHPLLAAILGIVTLWTVVWVTGLYVSMRERPHRIRDKTLTLRLGIRRWCDIPLADIRETRLLSADVAKKPRDGFGDFTLKHCGRMEILLNRSARIKTLSGESGAVNGVWVTADDLPGLQAALHRD